MESDLDRSFVRSVVTLVEILSRRRAERTWNALPGTYCGTQIRKLERKYIYSVPIFSFCAELPTHESYKISNAPHFPDSIQKVFKPAPQRFSNAQGRKVSTETKG